MNIENDAVVTIAYTLTDDDGQVVDSSSEPDQDVHHSRQGVR